MTKPRAKAKIDQKLNNTFDITFGAKQGDGLCTTPFIELLKQFTAFTNEEPSSINQ